MDITGYYNTLIAETVSSKPTSSKIFATIIAILTSQFIGSSKTVYKNNAAEVLKKSRIEFDFIVVGTGSSGSVITGRLTEASHLTTLSLEAGCDDAELCTEVPALFSCLWRTKQDWQYTSKDTEACKAMQDGNGCYVPRGKTIGGSSEMNVMYAIRGSYHIYDEWADEYECNGWSSYEVIPYFKKSEGNTDPSLDLKYHCTKGPLKLSYYNRDNYSDFILAAANEAGFRTVKDINAPHGPCICSVQGTLINGRRNSVAKAFINPIQCRRNFKLIKCAVVIRIIFDGNKAIGVEFEHKGKRYKAYARKEVILCAGSIATPLILQLSGIGLQEDLKHNKIKSWLSLPVGRFLQDHLGSWMWFSSDGDADPPGKLFSSITEYFSCPRTGDFTGIGTVSVIGFFDIPISKGRATIECYFYRFAKQSINLEPFLALTKYKKSINNRIIEANKYDSIILVVPTLLNPKSHGYVRLNGKNGKAAFYNPYIFYNYFSDRESYDKKSLVQAMQLLLSFAHTPTWKAANVKFIRLPICEKYSKSSSYEYCNCYLKWMGSGVFHPVGTARMGPKPEKHKTAKSVVNCECQVHGTENLSVADASIIPKIPWGDINLSTIMIGEKCADYIKKRHRIYVKHPKCETYKSHCTKQSKKCNKFCCRYCNGSSVLSAFTSSSSVSSSSSISCSSTATTFSSSSSCS